MEDLNKIKTAHSILQKYNGDNAYLHYLKSGVFAYKKLTLTEYQIEYILQNHDKQPKLINKCVRINDWYGQKLQLDYNIEFKPEKLVLGYLLAENETHYHVYIQWRKSQSKMELVFLPKACVLTDFKHSDFKDFQVDFEKYNKLGNIVMKPQQEMGVKFLLSRKKGILSLQMGGGKTLTSIVAALEGNFNKILIVSPASVKSTWQRELTRFINEEEITIVEGSKWKENKFTIINYDILDNFYELPTEIVNQKVKEFDEDGNITYKTVQKERMSRKKSVIDEAMSNSQLFQSNFDCIIIDEIHRLSNKTSGRFKILLDLITRTHPQAIFGLTGTMITNNPQNLYNVLKIIGAEITNDWQFYMKHYCGAKPIFNKKERNGYTKQFLNTYHKNSWYDLTYDEKNKLNELLEKRCKKIWIMGEAQNLDELSERIKHLYYRDENIDNKIKINTEIKTIDYDLTIDEKDTYLNAWNDYVSLREDEGKEAVLDTKQLVEGSILRQVTSKLMIPRTIELVKKHIKNGEKVIIACCFDAEVEAFKEEFGDIAVVYNGKMTRKKKDEAENAFMNDDNIKVFIGNIIASSVGLTLTSSHIVIFNSVSFVPSDNEQMRYRVIRIGQTHDCTIYYQKFNDTYMEHIFEILDIKNKLINEIIKTENEK